MKKLSKYFNSVGLHLIGFIVSAGILIASPGFAEYGDPPFVSADSVDVHIHVLMAERQIPGLSLVVVKDGSIIKEGHYGLANVELNVPVNENTSFMIASMSKAFTAAGLMVLVDDGKVELDDPVTNYLDDLPPSWNNITLRQLANNTSGLSNDWNLHPPGANDFFLTSTTNEAFLRALADVPLLFTPGEAFNYAAGTFVIGMVIEKISGMAYAEFMHTRVFEPLGMTHTMINDASRLVPHRASGYRIQDGVLTRGRRISPAAEARGDVGVLTTALDLAKWDSAFRDTRLLSQNSLDAISTPARLNDGNIYPYGLGWSLEAYRGYRSIGHSGTFRTGYSSEIIRFPKDDLTVILVANLHAALGEDIGVGIAGFYSTTYRPISSMTPRTDPDPARSEMLQSVLGVVGSGIHDPDRLTPGFPISLYTHSRWQERHIGLQSFSFIDCQDRLAEGYSTGGEAIRELCFYRFSEEQGTGYLVYSLAQDGKVADLYVEEFVAPPQGVVGEAPPAFRYPVTRTVDVVDDYHGTRVRDPFRWLEALGDEETRSWAAAQNAFLDSHLADDPVRERVRSRMTEMLSRLDDFSNALPPQQAGGREFFMHTNAEGPALYVRFAPDTEPRLLVDPRTFSEQAGLIRFWVAPDSRHVAYALSDGGSEWVELRIRNVDSGVDLPEVLQGMIFPSIVWTRDSRGFLYTHAERPVPGEVGIRRDPAVHYHGLGTAQKRDRVIFSTPPGTTDIVLSVGISEDGRYAFIYEGSGSYQGALGWALTRMHFFDLKHGEHPDFSGRPVAVNAHPDAAYNVVGSDGSVAYILTSKDAPRHRVVAVDLHDHAQERWRDVIPQAEGVLQSVHRIGSRWVAAYLEDVHSVLRVFSDDGAALGEIPLPTLGSVFAIRGNPSAPEVTFTFSSLNHPDTVLRHDLDSGRTTTVRRLDNGFDTDGYETRQLWFTSQDGTRVPMFIIHRKGIRLDGANSTILHGYGSSGTSLLPEFSERTAMWLELGGVYAVANIRGGGEFGQAWYEAATLGRKQTSFDDFIAAAEYLISTGYTTPKRLAIHGHSFGGLLVGAVMTQRPDLFAAVISENPVLDMLRRDPGRHAAQYGWVADPADFPFLFTYSPLHAVKAGTCYPATLVTTAFNDDRVPAWHPFKFTAALQAAQSCPQPVMLRTADSGGHAGSGGDPELTAEIWAFAARHTGLTSAPLPRTTHPAVALSGSAADLGAVATRIAQNADIKEGEMAWIYGGAQDVELMEKLAVAVAALGGQPLVSLFSDVTMRDWYRDVPEHFDTMRDDWRWQIHENADVVFLLTRIDPATYAGIDSERLRAYGAANSGLWNVLRERGVRIVWIGNRAHPSEWSARMFGIGQRELETIFWNGMAADRDRLTELGYRFREILHAASTVRIQHPNGTDITMGVAGQRIVVTDGSFSPTRTGPDPSTGLYETWLPGGEVTLGIDPESAEGRLVLERFFMNGEDMGPTTLTFSGGTLLELESGSALLRLREYTQSALPMSERLTGLKFGINPDITDERILPLMGAGIVSPTLGSNLVLGGDIDLPFGPIFLTLAGSTIYVDDRIVVQEGKLKL